MPRLLQPDNRGEDAVRSHIGHNTQILRLCQINTKMLDETTHRLYRPTEEMQKRHPTCVLVVSWKERENFEEVPKLLEFRNIRLNMEEMRDYGSSLAFLVESTTDHSSNMSTLTPFDFENMVNTTDQTRSGISIYPPVAVEMLNICLYLMIALGVPENLLVLVVFMKDSATSTTDCFIIAITFCDLVTSALNVPIYASMSNGLWTYFGSDVVCVMHMFISQTIVLSSTFLIAALALDRYIRVCKPLLLSYTKKKAQTACILIMLLTTLVSIPTGLVYSSRNNDCLVVNHGLLIFGYYILVFAVFVAAVVIVVYAYVKVTLALQDRSTSTNSHSHDWKISWRIQQIQQPIATTRKPAETNVPSVSNLGSDRVTHIPRSETDCRKANTISTDKETTGVQTPSYLRNKKPPTIVSQAVTMRTTKIAFLVCIIYIVTWLPTWAVMFIAFLSGYDRNPVLATFCLFAKKTFLINNVANPIIYAGLNPKFRRSLIRFCRCGKQFEESRGQE